MMTLIFVLTNIPVLALQLNMLENFLPPEILRPLPTGEQLNSICTDDRGIIFCGGKKGAIMKLNTSSRPERSNNLHPSLITGISSNGNQQLICCGTKGALLLSTDSGSGWKKLNSGIVTDLHAVQFIDHATAFACGIQGDLLKSTNSGFAWENLNTGTSAPFYCMDFFNEKFGCIGSVNSVFISSDSGKTWIMKPTGSLITGQIKEIRMIDTHTIYAVINSAHGGFAKSTDFGNTWSVTSLSLPPLFGGAIDLVTGMEFEDNANGAVVTTYGSLLLTTDSGTNWMKDSTFRPSHEQTGIFADIICYGGYYYICGSGGSVYRVDPHTRSIKNIAGNLSDIASVSEASPGEITIAGEGSGILASTDGGMHWKLKYNFEAGRISSHMFLNSATAIALSCNSIYRTENAGIHWTKVFEADMPLNSLVTGNRIFAGGGDESSGRTLILSSSDNGCTWQVSFEGGHGPITSLHSSDGYVQAVTGQGNVLVSEDEQMKWNVLSLSNEPLLCIAAKNRLTSAVGGVEGLIYITHSGWKDFDVKFAGQSRAINDIKYFDNHIVAAGSDGFLSRSDDGGISWNTQESGTGNNLRKLHYINGGELLCFGDHGTVIALRRSGTILTPENCLSSNPSFANMIIANLQLHTLKSDQIVEASLFDCSGRRVFVSKQNAKSIFEEVELLKLSLPSGIYFLKILSGKMFRTVKIANVR